MQGSTRACNRGQGTTLNFPWVDNEGVGDEEAQRAVLATVAVLEPHATVGRVAELAGLTTPKTRAIVSTLVDAEVLATDEPLRFVDPGSRQTTYDGLPAAVRASLHDGAADLMQRQHHASQEFVWHVECAEPAGRQDRVEVLREAAQVARAEQRVTDAVRLLRRALQEPAGAQRPAVLIELGRVELELPGDEGLTHLGEALDLVSGPQERIAVLTELAHAMTLRGRAEQALERLLTEQHTLDDDDLRLRLDAVIVGTAALMPSHVAHARERLTAFAQLAGRTPDERAALALACLSASTAEASAELARRALHNGAFVTDEGLSSAWLHRTVVTLARAGAVDEAQRVVDELAGALGPVAQSPLASAVTHWSRASVRMLAGDVPGARRDAEVALEGALDGSWTLGVRLSAAVLVDAALAAGDTDTACRALEHVPEQLGDDIGDRWLRFARARVSMSRGNLRDAARDLDAVAVVEPGPLTAWSVPLWPEQVRLRLAAGRRNDAEAIAAAALEKARAWGGAEAISRALRAVAATLPDAARAQPLADAWAVTDSAGCAVERVLAGAELGAALRRAGRRAEAAQVLRAALELADEYSALAHVETVRRELAVLGQRPRRARRSGPNALTPREHEITTLAASGVTNDEIARSLFITAKTVETHLTRAYRKLGIAGRGELREALD